MSSQNTGQNITPSTVSQQLPQQQQTQQQQVQNNGQVRYLSYLFPYANFYIIYNNNMKCQITTGHKRPLPLCVRPRKYRLTILLNGILLIAPDSTRIHM